MYKFVSLGLCRFVLTFWLLSSRVKYLSCHLRDGGLVLDIADAQSTTKMDIVFNTWLAAYIACLMIFNFNELRFEVVYFSFSYDLY